MQQKIKEMLIKIKDVLVSVWHSYKRMRQENNIYFNILVGLVFFAIVGTGVCMVANAREAAALRQVEIQKEISPCLCSRELQLEPWIRRMMRKSFI